MSESTPIKQPLLSDGLYTKLKHTAAVLLPAVSALYIGLAQIWHFPKVEEVAGSLTTINTFIGALVLLSTRSYNNSGAKYVGEMLVDDSGTSTKVSLNLNEDAVNMLDMPEVTFKTRVIDTGGNPIIRSQQ